MQRFGVGVWSGAVQSAPSRFPFRIAASLHAQFKADILACTSIADATLFFQCKLPSSVTVATIRSSLALGNWFYLDQKLPAQMQDALNKVCCWQLLKIACGALVAGAVHRRPVAHCSAYSLLQLSEPQAAGRGSSGRPTARPRPCLYWTGLLSAAQGWASSWWRQQGVVLAPPSWFHALVFGGPVTKRGLFLSFTQRPHLPKGIPQNQYDIAII